MIAGLGDLYVRWRVRRSLDGVWVRGIEHLEEASERGPVLIVANHVAWWDGLVARLVDRAVDQDGRPLVAADTLRRVPMLRWFGAEAIEPGLAAWGGVRRAVAHLDRPRRAIWIFPQGRQRPAAVRPLGFHAGFGSIARRAGAAIVPVALDYPFRAVHLPAAAVAVGAPVGVEDAEAAVATLLTSIQCWADGGAGFTPLVPSRQRAIDDGVGARLLSVRT